MNISLEITFYKKRKNLIQTLLENIIISLNYHYYMLCYSNQHADLGFYIYNVSLIVLSTLLQMSLFIFGNLIGILNPTLYSIHRGRVFSFYYSWFREILYSLVLFNFVLIVHFFYWNGVCDFSLRSDPEIELNYQIKVLVKTNSFLTVGSSFP